MPPGDAMAKNGHLNINYARPSFLEGIARLLDFGGALDNYGIPYLDDLRAGRVPTHLTRPETDVAAMRADWIAVGECIRDAMTEISATTGASGSTPQEQ